MKLLSLAETSDLTCLGTSDVLTYSNTNKYGFPGYVKVGDKAPQWIEEEIIEWLEARIATIRPGDGQTMAVP